MSGLHCRSQTCSQMLHQVAIIFPSSVKTGRSPSSSTPTIVAFVPPGMTSWHDDTICKKVQAPNPIHVLHEAHSALRLGSPTNIGDPPTYREDVVVKFTAPVYHSTITCRSVLLRRTQTTKQRKMHRAESSIVRWGPGAPGAPVRLGPPIQGCMACSIGFNTALATWHSLRFGPALAHV